MMMRGVEQQNCVGGDELDARRVRGRPEDARRVHGADPQPEAVVRVSDPYEMLGVARDADVDAIRKAYRKLARKHHPDLNPGDKAAEERFKEISQRVGGARGSRAPPQLRRVRRDLARGGLRRGEGAPGARGVRQPLRHRRAARARRASARSSSSAISTICSGRFIGGRGGRAARGMRMRGADLEAVARARLPRRRARRRAPAHARARRRRRERDDHRADSARRRHGRPAADPRQGRARASAAGRPATSRSCCACGRTACSRREGRDLTFDLPITRGRGDSRREGRGARRSTAARRSRSRPAPTAARACACAARACRIRAADAPGDLFARIQIRVPRQLDDAAKQRARCARAPRGPRHPQGALLVTRRSIRTSEVLVFLGAEEQTAFFRAAAARRGCSRATSSRPRRPTSCGSPSC